MFAICSMVRKPFNFETWLDYHFSLGINHIFLRIEDTPELFEVLKNYKDKVSVDYVERNDTSDNYWKLIDRQVQFVTSVIKSCQKMNISWLGHIDSDELVWCEDLNILNDVNDDIECVILKNYEAVYQNDNLQNPFLETNRFTKPKLAYANGKPFGRISENLVFLGPHRFDGKSYTIERKMMILHFESPNFDHWYKKFKEEKSETSDEMLEKIPFRFYRESIELVRSGDLKKCREYYNKMKVEPYESSLTMKLFWTPLRKEKNSIWTK